MKLNVAYESSIGRVRQKNEDNAAYFYDDQDHLLAIVADGIGGNRAGEVASKMAVDGIGKHFKTQSVTPGNVTQWFTEQINQQNQEILGISKQHQQLKGMGTTFVGVILFDHQFMVCNIGDSRGYLYRDHRLQQLTIDHSYVNELLRAGKISKEELATSPYKHVIVRSLGISEQAEPSIDQGSIHLHDQFLLCSDGLTDLVSDSIIKLILESSRTVHEKCQKLVELANQNGGTDNITVLISEVAADQGVDNND
ncbi:Stp1/IreP family PP2C-type Ser/Thr phosphatase [Nicoliella lavandulae]|uniref:Stp1/IreP family PP2C-type Ser/Thr phosphatase n=1 Tax=Nicoliella lavandulae TaxID=3082954 RepID=A0ABU8SKZ8_9LACO